MGLIITGTITGLIGTAAFVLAPGLINGLLLDALPALSKALVRRSARRLIPIERAAYEADWLANLEDYETKLGKLRWSLGCFKASLAIEPPFTLTYHRAWRRFHFYAFQGAVFAVVETERSNNRMIKALMPVHQAGVARHYREFGNALRASCIREQASEPAEQILKREIVAIFAPLQHLASTGDERGTAAVGRVLKIVGSLFVD